MVLAAGKLEVIEARLSTATTSKKDAKLLCFVVREGQKFAEEYKCSFTEAFLCVISDAETRLRIGIRDMPHWTREEIPAPGDRRHPTRWIDSRTSGRILEKSASPQGHPFLHAWNATPPFCHHHKQLLIDSPGRSIASGWKAALASIQQ